MNRIILTMLLFISFVHAERFSMITEYLYIKNCDKSSNGQLQICTCMLNEIEKSIAEDNYLKLEKEFVETNQMPKKFKLTVMDALLYCRQQKDLQMIK